MIQRFVLCCAALLVTALFPAFCVPSLAEQGETWRVSLCSTGEQANGVSRQAAISADGRYVAFTSAASNLVEGDTNHRSDVFVHDRLTGEIEHISVSSSGEQGNDTSTQPAMSVDGKYVAFHSSATNLVESDVNGHPDIFVHDRATGVTELVSVSSEGEQGNQSSHSPSISADGRYVAFDSYATNLGESDTNGLMDVFVHDRATRETRMVSVSSWGEQGNSDSRLPSISADGRYVAFTSAATNLVEDDTNEGNDSFVRDLMTGQTERVSVSSSGEQGNGRSTGGSISADGRYVAFSSRASNLVDDDGNDALDVFVHDRVTGETERVSVSSSGAEGNANSGGGWITAHGRYVAFISEASNLVEDDTNACFDVFVRDRVTGETRRVSVSSAGVEGNDESGHFGGVPEVAAYGRYVVFGSDATNLVDDDTNDEEDVFVHQYTPGDVVAGSPDGWLNVGWNRFSVPLDPAGWPDASNLLDMDCRNILWRWDPVGKTTELYPWHFRYLVRGRGYLLWLTSEIDPTYDALEPEGDFEIDLPRMGWTWVGHPFDHDTPLADCSIRHNPTEEVRKAWEDFRERPYGWMNWNIFWWDSAADSWKILSLHPFAHDDTLHPWYGYLVWSNTDDLTLIVPEQ